MNDRYSKNVLETKESIRENYSKLPVVKAGEYALSLSVYTDKDGNQAVVPPGWTVSPLETENRIWGCTGLVLYFMPPKWTKGLTECVIIDEFNVMKVDCDQIVWVPVSFLDPDGTLDGVNFSEKFGRRNYQNDIFSTLEFHEEISEELREQIEFIETYGGFYITRYNISEDVYGNFRSSKGHLPVTDINIDLAKEFAATFGIDKNVRSHLPFGAEYDSILAWFIKSGARTLKDINEDSSKWGNYIEFNSRSPIGLLPTGFSKRFCTNNISDYAGNVDEWTQEKYGSNNVIRGTYWYDSGREYPVNFRNADCEGVITRYTGFRAAVYFK